MHRPHHLPASMMLCLLLCGSPLHAQTPQPPAPDPQAAAHRERAKERAAQGDFSGVLAEYQ
ncbi:MAG: hypothetical protein M3Y28_12120, partial [Armatimonadota bacterium]|nr:hypothetical protein [Armatimonadota bacterium]